MIKESQFYKILVIEDNLGDFVLLEDYITDSFIKTEIIHVTSYSKFVDVMKVESNFDIAFLDLTLPDKYGLDLIKAATALAQAMPIIVLTGYPDFDFARQSLMLGVSDYLLKEDLNVTTVHKCIIYNIERHKSITRIKKSEQYYADLFQLSPNPLLVFDDVSGTILNANAAALETYKYNLDQFKNIKIDDLQVENKLCDTTDQSLILNDGDSKLSCSTLECHCTKNGELLYISSSKNSIIYNDKPAVIVSIENLTKEIVYLQAMQNQNQKLKQIAWMQSHVIRAPVARIMGLTNLLLQNSTTDPNNSHLVKMVQISSLELDSVIHDIVKKTEDI